MRLKYYIITIAAIILVLTTASCKDSSTNSSDISIEIVNVTQSLLSLNQCDIGSGPLASEFLFDIEYEASEEIDIDGIEFDLLWSTGDEVSDVFSGQFNAAAETVTFDWCFRYGAEEEWFELDLKIIAENENVESNEFNIRIDKPEGANKNSQ